MRQAPPDGDLVDWDEVSDEYSWNILLLGNGLSVRVWKSFAYASLYSEAQSLGTGVLSAPDQALFEGLDTQNFEYVLGQLNAAIAVADATGVDSTSFLDRYQTVQAALGSAVRAVHLPWTDVPGDTLQAIKRELHHYEWVFTTSYDLVLYWAMGHNETYGRLVDLFWGSECRFDPANADVFVRSVPVYFLHGAMHLIAEGDGRTRKLIQTATHTLLDQFGQPIGGDSLARPLLVTEGSSRHKLQAIEGNAYLAHCLDRLRERDGPLVVFGSSLGEQDRHLTEAISANPERPVAVSMMPGGSKADRRARQADIFGRVLADPLVFFDATTHPLGVPSLEVSDGS